SARWGASWARSRRWGHDMTDTTVSTVRISRADVLPVVNLDVLDHERWMLGYTSPAEETFAQNAMTGLLLPDDDEACGPAPRITSVAHPASATGTLDLAPLLPWLDSEKRRYEPAPKLVFVPMTRRPIADALLAVDDRRGNGRAMRSLVVRRTGTVEYGCYATWPYPEKKVWLIRLKQPVLQFAQFVRFLDDLAATFDRPRSWHVLMNATNTRNVVPVGYGEGWAEPWSGLFQIPLCWDDRFQMSFEYTG